MVKPRLTVQYMSYVTNEWDTSSHNGMTWDQLRDKLCSSDAGMSISTLYRAFAHGKKTCLYFKAILAGRDTVEWVSWYGECGKESITDLLMTCFWKITPESPDPFSPPEPPKPVYEDISVAEALAEASQGKEVFYRYGKVERQLPYYRLIWDQLVKEYVITRGGGLGLHRSVKDLATRYIFSRKVEK